MLEDREDVDDQKNIKISYNNAHVWLGKKSELGLAAQILLLLIGYDTV